MINNSVTVSYYYHFVSCLLSEENKSLFKFLFYFFEKKKTAR